MNKTVQNAIPDSSMYEQNVVDLKKLRIVYPTLRDDEILMIMLCRARWHLGVGAWTDIVMKGVPKTEEIDENGQLRSERDMSEEEQG